MKKFLAFVLSAVMAAAFAGCGSGSSAGSETSATEAQTTKEALSGEVKSQLDAALSKANLKGVAQLTRGGEIIYSYVNGDDENGQPLTIDSSLPLASVSKQFCAASVMLLSDQSKLSVDDTLDRYFPDYQYGKQLTVRNLLNMSSGIPNYQAFLEPSMLGSDEAENVRVIKEAMFGEELDFEPGDDYEYSNSNYFLLADIVEQVSGVPYHDFLRTNIFEPLEMTHTGFVEEITDAPEWASALSKMELMLETENPGVAKGAGDIVSNAADMDKWLRGLSGGKLLSAEAYRQMTEDKNPNSSNGYCYGLWQMPFDGMGHVGQIEPHFGAVDYFNTERDVCLFAASNTLRGLSYVEQLPQELLNILFAQE